MNLICSPYPFHRKIKTQRKSYDIKHWLPIGDTPILLTAKGTHVYALLTFTSSNQARAITAQFSQFQFIEAMCIDNPLPPFYKHFTLVYRVRPQYIEVLAAAIIKLNDNQTTDIAMCNV